jgi:hypothetical protein
MYKERGAEENPFHLALRVEKDAQSRDKNSTVCSSFGHDLIK